MTTTTESPRGRRATWAAGLVVAAGAGVATAHGLYQVAAAANVPGPIAWLYPLITDGLALVAYAATARLRAGGRRYAAGIVVLAAGLSGLAQAVYLAGGIAATSAAPVGLRFGVGAWPAIAAALTAHLLHLISSDPSTAVEERSASNPPSNDQLYNPASNPVVQPRPTKVRTTSPVQPTAPEPLNTPPTALDDVAPSNPGGSASDRARAAARRHHEANGSLPTVSELMNLAQVARGTAGTVLKDLREQRPALHVVNTNPDQRTNQ